MKNNLFVFDTNILLSALFDENGTPAKALKKARTIGTLLLSDEIKAEYLRNLQKDKFEKYVPYFTA